MPQGDPHWIDPQQTQPLLVVGDIARWRARGRSLAGLQNVIFCDFEEVRMRLRRFPGLQLVISPLFARGFDAMDLAAVLAAEGFRGEYRVLTEPLPHPEVVLREMRDHWPWLNFDLLFISPDGRLSPR